MSFILSYIKKAWGWFEFSKPKANLESSPVAPLKEITPEEGKRILRAELTRRAEKGWKIEIENESDAVLSKKGTISWMLHIFILLFWAFVFSPMALIWLFIMVILAITKKPRTIRIWVEKDGNLYFR